MLLLIISDDTDEFLLRFVIGIACASISTWGCFCGLLGVWGWVGGSMLWGCLCFLRIRL